MFLFYLILYCFGAIFILVVIVALAISEMSVEKSIREELRKYGYELVSVKSTKRRFPIKESSMQFWQKHLFLGYAPARNTLHYKEIRFKNDVNEEFQNIVAVEVSPFFSTRLHFEVDLKWMKGG